MTPAPNTSVSRCDTRAKKGVAPSAKPSIWRRIGAWYGPAAAQRPVVDGRLQLEPEGRAARQFLHPAACVELQATAKPRTVGRVSSGQFARSPRRSRV